MLTAVTCRQRRVACDKENIPSQSSFPTEEPHMPPRDARPPTPEPLFLSDTIVIFVEARRKIKTL